MLNQQEDNIANQMANLALNYKIIQNGRKLDQIIIHDNKVLVCDWAENAGVHVLDNELNYKNTFKCPGSIANCIALLKNGLIGVLQNDKISLFRYVENYNYENIRRVNINRMITHRENKLLGLCQNFDENDDSVYFIEMPSRTVAIFSNNYENLKKRKIELPPIFRLAGVRDLKIHGNKIFINDYKFDRFGNDCIHVFDLNVNYLTSFGLNEVEKPKCLELRLNSENKLNILVSEWKAQGSYKVFEEKEIGDYKLKESVQLNNCNYPIYICHYGNKLLCTQLFKESDYQESNKLFFFNEN